MASVELQFQVWCNDTVVGQAVGVCGTGVLGDWDIARGLVLDGADYPIWTGRVIAPVGADLEFKYVLLDNAETRSVVRWEGDWANRQLRFPASPVATPVVLRHCFGQAKDPETAPVAEQSDGKDSRQKECATTEVSASGYPSGNSDKIRKESGKQVLAKLEVEPSVRATRLVRSKSGCSLDAKYEVFQRAVLGTGMSGGVCKAKVRATGVEVAVKTLVTSRLTAEQFEQTLAEVQNQLSMDHPNICRLLEVYEEPGRLRLVMERMRGPDLYDHWTKRGRYFERDACSIVRQMCSAVAYCHRHNVCHRDLKLENFCLEDDTDDARIKMIDFGLSSSFTSLPMTSAVGTLFYVAPEVLSGRYTEKCDMWSLGVITYILLAGRAPFHGADDRKTFRLIKAGVYDFPEDRWGNISAKARSFVADLLCVDTYQRLTAEQALAHVWLADAEEEGETQPLDPEVLSGLRAFTRSNALKRAVLTAIAPVATVEHIARWAAQFEQLDEDGDGTVPFRDLMERLKAELSVTDAEAEALREALSADGDHKVSYSAFLAACLCADPSLGEPQIQELFARLDKSGKGRISIEEFGTAMGDVVNAKDMDELREEFGDTGISFDDFRWLLIGPRFGTGSTSLFQLLGQRGGEQWNDWRVQTRLAKAKTESPEKDSDDAAMEAARRENAAWRLLALQGGKTKVDDEQPATDAANLVSADELRKGDLPDVQGGGAKDVWTIATAEAKADDGNADAARRENMAWRQWHMEQAGQQKVDTGVDGASEEPAARGS